MSLARRRRYRRGLAAMLLLLVTLLAVLQMMSSAVQNSAALTDWFMPLLLFSVAGLLLLVVLISINLFKLLRDYRHRVAGSRLALRLVVIFTLLAVVPAGLVFHYSLQFLLRGIDSWYDVQIDNAMEDALALSQASLGLHRRELLRFTQRALGRLEDSSRAALALSLGEVRDTGGAVEMTLLDGSGRLVAASNANPESLIPDRPDNALLQQVRAGTDYAGLTPWGEGDQLHIRVVTRDPAGRDLILQAIYPTSSNISDLSDRVQNAYAAYRERAYLRESIKFSFALTLSLALFTTLFFAAWAAFWTARRLVAPVRDIAEGTRAVAAGDYDKQLPMPRARDELSFLVASFNAMTRRIAQARNAAERSQRELEAQRAYLQTVLAGLSNGVMALDPQGLITTANPAAQQILSLDLAAMEGRPLRALAEENPQLQPFVDGIAEDLGNAASEWRGEIALYRQSGRQVLLCRRSALDFGDHEQPGQVLVFDDITALIKAQRDAAWGEVARRLAHEIKNPLTPIQLSAERLRHKCLGRLDADLARVLDRATHTIIQQVEAMKTMVNAFSDYAKPSQMQPQPVQLDALVGEVLELYRGLPVPLYFHRNAAQARIDADPVRLRQVLHNLLKNAEEAVANCADGQVDVHTLVGQQNDCQYVEIQVLDNGPGFDPDQLDRVFDPYVTSKEKGTGLGLAIVKKIVDEHGGAIWAENRAEGGGRMIIRLPALSDPAARASCDKLASNIPRSQTL
jgi:nitrogen fixation/metabolism regulation signal transduction histidine kinase